MPHASREERLDLDGVAVCWEIENIPERPEWPPPALPPHCVAQLPRAHDDGGRVSAEMVVPGVHAVVPNTDLVTIYVTSSGELIGALSEKVLRRQPVQVESSVTKIADLKTLEHEPGPYRCYSVASSSTEPPMIAIGTQHGILVTQIRAADFASPKTATSLQGSPKNSSVDTTQSQMNELESSNRTLQAEVHTLSGELKRSRQIRRDTALKLAMAEDRATSLQSKLNEVNQRLDEAIGKGERDSRLTYADYKQTADPLLTNLQKELTSSKETEDSLRNQIAILEEENTKLDRELEDARVQAAKYSGKCKQLTLRLQDDTKEQKMAIDSLVDLLDRQRIHHAEEIASRHDEIVSLKRQTSDLRDTHQRELDEANESNADVINGLRAELSVMRADAAMGNELFAAMKKELKNALRELADYRLERR